MMKKHSQTMRNICCGSIMLTALLGTIPMQAVESQNVTANVTMVARGVQQARTITGLVKDEFGMGIPGVNVKIKGTTEGTITDADGNFSLSGVTTGAVLEFSYIGFLPQEVKVGNANTITVTLKEIPNS